MTAKEYLEQLNGIKVDIQIIKEDIKQAEELATSVSPSATGGGGSGGCSDKIGRTVAVKVDLEAKKEQAICQFLEIRDKIKKQIEAMPDKRYQRLLMLHYVLGHDWQEVADIVSYSYSYIIHKLHPQALQAFEKMYQKSLE